MTRYRSSQSTVYGRPSDEAFACQSRGDSQWAAEHDDLPSQPMPVLHRTLRNPFLAHAYAGTDQLHLFEPSNIAKRRPRDTFHVKQDSGPAVGKSLPIDDRDRGWQTDPRAGHVPSLGFAEHRLSDLDAQANDIFSDNRATQAGRPAVPLFSSFLNGGFPDAHLTTNIAVAIIDPINNDFFTIALNGTCHSAHPWYTCHECSVDFVNQSLQSCEHHGGCHVQISETPRTWTRFACLPHC